MRRLLASLIVVVTAFVATVGATQATALPVAPAPAPPVTGIPEPCLSTTPFPEDASIGEIQAQLAEQFDFRLAGKQWTEEYRPSIRILWETLDAMACTDYVETLQGKFNGTVGLNTTNIRGYAWGDWSLTRSGYVSFDFEKFKGALSADDEGRLVRLVAHELAHVYNSDRHTGSPQYWSDFQRLFRQEGRFSDYAGRSVTETFADVVGYYVGRCALDNPYDTGEHAAYYAFARDVVFGGKEFGPEPGVKPECIVPDADAETPQPGAEVDVASWVTAVSGE